MSKETTTVQMSYEAFVNNAILKLRDVDKSKGINPRFSGLNEAMKVYYGADALAKETEQVKIGEDTVNMTGASAIVQRLAKAGKIDMRPTRGGVQIFIKGELKGSQSSTQGTAVLTKLGLAPHK